MKILFDHQIFTAQKYGGISRYFSMLFGQFDQKNIQYELPAIYSSNYYLKDLMVRNPGKLRIKNIENRQPGRILQRYTNYHNVKESLRLVSRGDYDVFHPTYYDPYFLKRLGSKPLVVTVHDMIHEIFPEHFPLDDPVIAWKQELLDRASHIVAVSANTKKDLLNLYDIDGKKISVIYHGNPLFPAGDVKSSTNNRLPDKYLLFVGDRSLYKNFYFFTESVVPLLKADPGLRLVCVGGKPFFRPGKYFLQTQRPGRQGRIPPGERRRAGQPVPGSACLRISLAVRGIRYSGPGSILLRLSCRS